MSEIEIIPELTGEVTQSKLYIADKKVKSYSVIPDITTPSGGRIIHIIYADDTTEDLTEANFNAVKGYQKTDATKRRDKLVKASGAKLYALLMEYGPTLMEVDHCLNEAVRLVNDASEQAMNSLWGVEYTHQRTILDVNRILSAKYAKQTKTETTENTETSS